MAAKEHKERKRTISARFLCFLMALGALVLPSVFSYAEDLTTLDGKTFTNITEVGKYPKLVVFTYNSNRTAVAISNLPDEFLAEHGIQKLTVSSTKVLPQIQILTNNTSKLTVETTPQLDAILADHPDSVLEVEEGDYSCSIRLSAKHFELNAFIAEFYTGVIGDNTCDVKIDFDYVQEVALNQVFNKFLEWDAIASKNNAESFEKDIPCMVGDRAFAFNWYNNSRGLLVSTLLLKTNAVLCFHKDHVVKLQECLKNMPEFKRQLIKKIENQEAQRGLFK